MKRTNIYLPVRLLESLKAISDRKGISVSELIRRILDSYIEKEEDGLQK